MIGASEIGLVGSSGGEQKTSPESSVTPSQGDKLRQGGLVYVGGCSVVKGPGAGGLVGDGGSVQKTSPECLCYAIPRGYSTTRRTCICRGLLC